MQEDGRSDDAESVTALIGQILGGQYRIDALLGEGGMGCVYRATQLSVRRAVAIKLITRRVPQNVEVIKRFQREAEAMGRLAHPHTVRLFDQGVTPQGDLYLVMELLQGCDLSERLKQKGALPPPAALQIARQALQALGEAHELGIVHRDLKPGNVFLSTLHDGEFVKLMDFGIADLTRDADAPKLTKPGVLVGTPGYMSPEQVRGARVDHRSDFYSLGIILFEMLTGRPPFEGDSMVALVLAHMNEPPPTLASVRPELAQHPQLQELLDALLAKDPDARPSDARGLCARIDALLEAWNVPQHRSGSSVAVGSTQAAAQPAPQIPSDQMSSNQVLSNQASPSETPMSWQQRSQPPQRAPARRTAWLGIVPVFAIAALAAGFYWNRSVSSLGAPPPPAAPLPKPVAPVEPAVRSVTLASTPSGASVLSHGAELGKTPYVLQFRDDISVDIVVPGYQPQRITVTSRSEPNLVVTLSPLSTPDATAATAPIASGPSHARLEQHKGVAATSPAVSPAHAAAAGPTLPASVAAPTPPSAFVPPAPQPAIVSPPSPSASSSSTPPPALPPVGGAHMKPAKPTIEFYAGSETINALKREYRYGRITRGEYRRRADRLDARLEAQIRDERREYRAGWIARDELARRIRVIKLAYAGLE